MSSALTDVAEEVAANHVVLGGGNKASSFSFSSDCGVAHSSSPYSLIALGFMSYAVSDNFSFSSYRRKLATVPT